MNLNFAAKITTVALTSTLIFGCATKPPMAYEKHKVPYTTNTSVLDIISVETQKAMNAAKQLAKYQASYNATLDYRQRQFDNDQIMVDYIGKPNDILNSVAIRYGYRYIEIGNVQELPTVNYTRYWTTPNNLIVDMNAKLGNSGNIALDKSQKVITLIYPQTNINSNTQ